MDDLINSFPKKSRFENMDLDGLSEDERKQIIAAYEWSIRVGNDADASLAYANSVADELKSEKLKLAEIQKYAAEKQALTPRPERNLTGDVTVRRMTAFIRFMNRYQGMVTIEQILNDVDNEWTDVIDFPVSEWDSDVVGLRLYMIGGGRIVLTEDSGWVYAADPPDELDGENNQTTPEPPKSLNTY